jgi:hypothetical protein
MADSDEKSKIMDFKKALEKMTYNEKKMIKGGDKSVLY